MHFMLHDISSDQGGLRKAHRTSLTTPVPLSTLTTASSPLSLSNVLACTGESTRIQKKSSRIWYAIGFDPSSVSSGARCDRRSSNKSMKTCTDVLLLASEHRSRSGHGHTSKTQLSPASALHFVLNKHSPCNIAIILPISPTNCEITSGVAFCCDSV